MKASEFDELLRSEFGQHEFAFNPDNWARMNGRLELPPPKGIVPAKRRLPRLVWGSGIAAALLIAACITWLALPGEKPGGASMSAFQPAPARTPLMLPAETMVPAGDLNPAGPAANHTTARIYPGQNTLAVTAQQEQKEQRVTENTPVPPHFANPPQHTIADEGRKPNSTIAINKPTGKQPPRQRIDLSNGYPDVYRDDEDRPARRATSFSVGGGINYGSLNTGYAVAVNARHNLGRNLFLEGDLGIVNNTAGNVKSLPAGTAANLGAGDAGMLPSKEFVQAKRRSINFFYVQFAPTIGYQLSSKLSVGAGPDFQQLLQSQDERNIVTNDDNTSAEVIPDFDFGVQGRTEYNVTSRLKAGLQYREGMNQLFRSGDEKYVNRRYMQVQLKYTLFGK